MLVEVSVPLEAIGRVECDYDGDYHVEVMGQEVSTNKDTYQRVIKARRQLLANELKIEVDG